MADYPSSIYNPATLTDGIDDVLASHQNLPNDEIEAIETELGTNPKTITDATAPSASPTSVAQYLDMVANIVKTISGSTTWTNAAAAAIMKSIGTAKGDLIGFSASGVPVRLAGSTTDGDVLTRGSTETLGVKWAAAAAAAAWGGITGTLSSQTDLQYALNPAGGVMINGKISPSVASNNLTLAIKTMAGNNPSTGEPVFVRIGDVLRSITSTLSVTVNAGANSFNAGSAELATKEIDFFPYLTYVSTSSAVAIGFGRIPYARLYSDFNSTATNEKYGVFSTTPGSTDNVVNIGRFAATLSAGAGYTWTVPTYTNANLIQHPIYETRPLTWTPTPATGGAGGPMTWTSVSVNLAEYQIIGRRCNLEAYVTGTTGGTANSELQITLPFDARNAANFPAVYAVVGDPNAVGGMSFVTGATPDYLGCRRYDAANFGLGAGRYILANGAYWI